MSDSSKWAQIVVGLAKVANSLDQKSSQELPLLVEASKVYLKGHATKMLDDCSPEAVVSVQRSCDCTHIKLRQHFQHKTGADSSRASARVGTEFFVSVIYVTAHESGASPKHAVIFKEPAQLERGKSMANLLSYMLATPGMMLGTGPRLAITLHHQIHDRGMSMRFRSALAGAVAEAQASHQECSDSASSDLLHFHTEAGCALHDGHNSLKWAHEHLFGKNVELLKALHIAIGAIRDSILKCYHGMGSWLANVVQPVTKEELPSEEARLQFFQIMGAPADVLSELVNDAGVWWHAEKGQLQAKSTFLQTQDSIGQLTNMLMKVWRPQSFSASRWATIGASCRSVALAHSTGLLSLHKHLTLSGSITDFEAHGSNMLQKEEIRFCYIIGLVSYVPETFVELMLRDNRLLKHGIDVLESAIEELQLLESVTSEVWTCLAGHVGGSPTDLRHQVISGCHVSLAYLDKRVFSTLTSLPWSLCIGDIAQNLQDLLEDEEMPHEVTAQKLWSLGKSGFDRRRLLQTLEAMRELCFTSHLTEKLHASAAVVKRHHPDYGARTTEMRSFVHTFRIRTSKHEQSPKAPPFSHPVFLFFSTHKLPCPQSFHCPSSRSLPSLLPLPAPPMYPLHFPCAQAPPSPILKAPQATLAK